jgi:hypothetical protein
MKNGAAHRKYQSLAGASFGASEQTELIRKVKSHKNLLVLFFIQWCDATHERKPEK